MSNGDITQGVIGSSLVTPIHMMNHLTSEVDFPIDNVYDSSDFGSLEEDEYPIDSVYGAEDEDDED